MKKLLKLLSVLAMFFTLRAHSAPAPQDTLTLVVPTSPGGLIHKVGLALQSELSQLFKKEVVIEFKPGAQGTVGAKYVADNKSQNITLFLAAIEPHGFPVDQTKDIVPVLDIGVAPVVLVVRPNLGVHNLQELVKKKTTLSVGYPIGTSIIHWVDGFTNEYKLGVVRVPYKFGTPAATDVAGGFVDAAVVGIPNAKGLIDAGKVEPLATLGTKRSTALPNVPTPIEQGIHFNHDESLYPSLMLWASPGIDPTLVKSIQKEFSKWSKTEEAQKLFSEMDIDLSPTATHPEVKLKSVLK